MIMIFLLLNIIQLAPLVHSGSQSLGSNCSSINNRLDSFTHKLITSCTDTTFCSGPVNGTCAEKLCRRDEFPFEYLNSTEPIPPMCDRGSFCPDEGSGCKPLQAVGSVCQLNRDEQCAPPPNWRELSSSQNSNGSICLKSTCMYANVTEGQPCILDQTTYYESGSDGTQFANVITRSNCKTPKFYCDAGRATCQRTRPIGSPCASDFECEQQHCSIDGLCAQARDKAARVATWHYAITAFFIVATMTVTCILLTLVHKRHRLQHYRELREYYIEQSSLRQTIIALHSAACPPVAEKPRRMGSASRTSSYYAHL